MFVCKSGIDQSSLPQRRPVVIVSLESPMQAGIMQDSTNTPWHEGFAKCVRGHWSPALRLPSGKPNLTCIDLACERLVRTRRRKYATLVALGALVSACSGKDEPTGPVGTSIVLNFETLALAQLDSVRLIPSVVDAKGQLISGVVVTFESSSTAIVTVSGVGVITAVGPAGSATARRLTESRNARTEDDSPTRRQAGRSNQRRNQWHLVYLQLFKRKGGNRIG
jgi:hypothetical protein